MWVECQGAGEALPPIATARTGPRPSLVARWRLWDEPLYRAQYADFHGFLPDRILAKTDRASMAASLEVHLPLLDHRERLMRHALSFDVEEYFQVANLADHFPRERWDDVPSRLRVGMGAVLGALARHRAKATFFFLGWIAERHPALVARCLEEGHEVASHGYEHAFLWDLGREGLAPDLERTERALMACLATTAAGAGCPCPAGPFQPGRRDPLPPSFVASVELRGPPCPP